MHLQKGLVYLYTKKFLPLLLRFWNYNLSPNGQAISLIGAQAHLKTRLVRAEWYNVLKIIHCTYLQPDKFKEKPSFDPIYQVSCFSLLGDTSCFHVFPENCCPSPPAQGKKIMFSTKNAIFPDSTGKTIFSEVLKKISSFRVLFKKDHPSFSG